MYKNWNPGSTEYSICHIKNINRPCHGLGSQREGKTKVFLSTRVSILTETGPLEKAKELPSSTILTDWLFVDKQKKKNYVTQEIFLDVHI